jgi:hypothetical protein
MVVLTSHKPGLRAGKSAAFAYATKSKAKAALKHNVTGCLYRLRLIGPFRDFAP